MIIDGKWEKDFDPVQAVDEEGGFDRQPSVFRNWITPDGSPGPTGVGGFKAESGRYHLYVGLICPWASRTLMARALKGLQSHIGATIVDPRLVDKVWQFGGRSDSLPGSQADPHYGFDYIYQLYLKSEPRYTGQVTIPVLWDLHTQTVVNNESADIIRMLNSGFGDLADEGFDLYPQPLRGEIDEVNERLYDHFNNGVYRAGFATTQVAYERAVAEVFDSLDYIDQRLQTRPYLAGNRFTEADIRAFVTLVRFDSAYYPLFKTNQRLVRDYPRISAYVQRIYELPGIAETVNLEHIKAGYFSISAINPVGLVPTGPEQPW